MNHHLSFILGGARSGKSRHALSILSSSPSARIFFATCPKGIDPEMDERIRNHQVERGNVEHLLAESEEELLAILNTSLRATVLLDSLTLWLFSAADPSWDHLESLIKKIMEHGDLIIVSDEIGMGLIPAERESREFRDKLGFLHQKIGAMADSVSFMVAGIPLKVK
jgi:adenosylcobinamide kinase / adenosylcobinamide-phosphate guanylyltransferase